MGRPSKFPAEFRESAVAMVRETGRPIAAVARDLGVSETTLGNWINADRRARGERASEELSESEPAELVRLRRDVAQLRMEREILKKAAAFFVTESTK